MPPTTVTPAQRAVCVASKQRVTVASLKPVVSHFGDDLAVFGAGREAALAQKLRTTMYAMNPKDLPALVALDGNLKTLLMQPGHSAETRSLALLMRSGAAGLQAQAGKSRISNGIEAYKLMKTAVAVDPTCIESVQALGRSTVALSQLNILKRAAVATAAGVNIDGDAKLAVKLLAAFPNDASCQLVRSKLADMVGDTAAKQAADAAVANLQRQNPKAVQAARADLDGDRQTGKVVTRDAPKKPAPSTLVTC